MSADLHWRPVAYEQKLRAEIAAIRRIVRYLLDRYTKPAVRLDGVV